MKAKADIENGGVEITITTKDGTGTWRFEPEFISSALFPGYRNPAAWTTAFDEMQSMFRNLGVDEMLFSARFEEPELHGFEGVGIRGLVMKCLNKAFVEAISE